MNLRLILVKSVTLLYRESERKGADISTTLISSLLNVIKRPENHMSSDFSNDPVTQLYDTLTWMVSQGDKADYDLMELLQRLRLNCGTDTSLFESLQSGIINEMSEDERNKFINSGISTIKQYLNRHIVKDIMKEGYIKSNHDTGKTDWRNFVQEMINKLEPHADESGGDDHPGIVNITDFNDSNSIKTTLGMAREEMDATGVIHFGFQGLNRMFGTELMGGRRGEFIVVSALQHNYKSGFVLDMFRHAAQYNTPYMIDPEKKPALLRISFENSSQNDTVLLYRRFFEQEFGEKVNINDPEVDLDTASKYVQEKLAQNGYHCLMVQIDPSNFSYNDLFKLVEQKESEGYEIHMLNIDYVGMMSKAGCVHGPHGTEYRDLFRRIRNFAMRKKILTITPAQMSTDAKRLLRGGVENFLRQVANKGYYDSCSTLDQEVDMEIYLHIVKINGESYLQIQRGKHRKPGITNERDMSCVYKFHPIGDIVDDVNGADQSRRAVGAQTAADGGELAWYTGM